MKRVSLGLSNGQAVLHTEFVGVVLDLLQFPRSLVKLFAAFVVD